MKIVALVALTATAATFAAADRAPAPRAVTAPADLTITYQRGPVAAEDGVAEFIELAPLDRTARTYRVARGTERFGTRTVTSRSVITGAAADRLYAVVVGADFFGLDRSYSDPDARDGAVSSLTVRAGARASSVTVSNVSVPRFGRVVIALGRL